MNFFFFLSFLLPAVFANVNVTDTCIKIQQICTDDVVNMYDGKSAKQYESVEECEQYMHTVPDKLTVFGYSRACIALHTSLFHVDPYHAGIYCLRVGKHNYNREVTPCAPSLLEKYFYFF